MLLASKKSVTGKFASGLKTPGSAEAERRSWALRC
jgi:hypothetical protein